MTLSFSRCDNGEIQLSVDAWRIRERDPVTNLPVRDFSEPFVTRLKRSLD
jgi:hypothetical protein